MNKNSPDRYMINGQNIKHLSKTELIEFGKSHYGLNFDTNTRRRKIENIIVRAHQDREKKVRESGKPVNGSRHVMEDPARLKGAGEIEEEFKKIMLGLAEHCDNVFNPGQKGADRKVGIVIMVYPFNGAKGRVNYLSNGADRDQIEALMKATIAEFEAGAVTEEGAV